MYGKINPALELKQRQYSEAVAKQGQLSVKQAKYTEDYHKKMSQINEKFQESLLRLQNEQKRALMDAKIAFSNNTTTLELESKRIQTSIANLQADIQRSESQWAREQAEKMRTDSANTNSSNSGRGFRSLR